MANDNQVINLVCVLKCLRKISGKIRKKSCLLSGKTQQTRLGELPGWQTHVVAWRAKCWGSKEAPCQFALHTHLSVPALYPFIINLSFGDSNISLSSISHSSSFMKSKERVIRNFSLQLVRLTCRCQPGFVSGIHNAERADVLKLQNLMLSLSSWC